MQDQDVFARFADRIRQCRLCEQELPQPPRPVFQAHPHARILVAAQAPGRRVHDTGIPFNDPSGDRLREWMGIASEIFYDARQVALVPMGFCFPGSGRSGDLPPRRECAPAWREPLLEQLTEVRLTLVVGQYAQRWHLPHSGRNLTATVRNWRDYHGAGVIPLPHPSPRNNLWLRRNPWFAAELLPQLRRAVRAALNSKL